MIPQRVLVVGDQLFAKALTHLLAEDANLLIVDCVSSVQDCLVILQTQGADTLIIAQSLMPDDDAVCYLLSEFPGKTIIKAHLESNQLEVITHQRISARPQELLLTLASLPYAAD
ncbi:MAG: hypothetical protein JJE12_08255 [Anaerolineales bacterium]|nr:hypothetical protein [Anaerolineales bacterium]